MKKGLLLGAILLIGTTCFANDMPVSESSLMQNGFFIGVGTNYNSINLEQNSWGRGISNIQTSTGIVSNGVAQGNGVPFHNLTNTFAPDAQAGYFTHIGCSDYLFGVKFTYQYLGATATNTNLYIPQLGETTSSTGTTSPLFGYVNGTSIQVSINHELNLLAFVGRSYGNFYYYIGAGPSVFNLKSRNYYSIGYADIDGVTINVTGLVSYSSPSIWAWGGSAQFGAAYFFSPTWFIDASYTYAVTGNNTTHHQQGFLNSSAVGSTHYTTSGMLFTRNTMSVNSQSVTVTINKLFDF